MIYSLTIIMNKTIFLDHNISISHTEKKNIQNNFSFCPYKSKRITQILYCAATFYKNRYMDSSFLNMFYNDIKNIILGYLEEKIYIICKYFVHTHYFDQIIIELSSSIFNYKIIANIATYKSSSLLTF